MKTISTRLVLAAFVAFACISAQLAMPAFAGDIDRDGVCNTYMAIDMQTAEDLMAIGVIEFDSEDEQANLYFALTGTGTVEFVVAGTPSTVIGGDTRGTGGTTIVTGGTTSST